MKEPLPALIDPAGRTVDYLRISITDRCNERCLYCLPENFHDWLPRHEVLSYDEILAIVEACTGLGFRRFRVTGGEPLLRAGVVDFLGRLVRLEGVQSVQITTNGTRLPQLAKPLFQAGLRRMNVSLDAIEPAVYRAITGGDVAPVLEGIRLAKALGFESIKLNTVLIRHRNESQIGPLLNFAAEHEIAIRFIELMPVSLTEMLDESNFLPAAEVMRTLGQDDDLEPISDALGFGPARYFRLKKRGVVVGFISALSDLHFCGSCNKMRLTCDGKLRPCLGNHLERDLKPALRPTVQRGVLAQMIRDALAEKPAEHLFRQNYQPQRVMTAIGG